MAIPKKVKMSLSNTMAHWKFAPPSYILITLLHFALLLFLYGFFLFPFCEWPFTCTLKEELKGDKSKNFSLGMIVYPVVSKNIFYVPFGSDNTANLNASGDDARYSPWYKRKLLIEQMFHSSEFLKISFDFQSSLQALSSHHISSKFLSNFCFPPFILSNIFCTLLCFVFELMSCV